VARPDNALLYKKYQELAERHSQRSLRGHLANYRYYSLEQVGGPGGILIAKLHNTRRLEVTRKPVN
jgi:UDP-galactopyranose mutase